MISKLLFVLALVSISYTAAIAGPAVWSVNSRADVLKGDSHGVSIDQDGTLTIAPKLTQVFKSEQAYIWSSAVDAAGNITSERAETARSFALTHRVPEQCSRTWRR